MPSIHENLSHLNTEEINQVIQLYESGKKVSEIATRYNIELQHGSLAPLLPPKLLPELCPYCGCNLHQEVSRENPSTYCPECSHLPGKSCQCTNCIKKGEKMRKSVRDTVLNMQTEPTPPSNLLHWLFQKSLYQSCHIGDGVLKPIEDMNVKLTPGNPLLNDNLLTQTLYNYGVIAISDKSSIYAFPEECDIPSFYTGKVCFITDTPKPTSYTDEELDKVRMLVAASEVVEYIAYQIDKVSHRFTYNDSIAKIILELLNNFSQAQIFSIIWSSVNYTTRCYSEGWLKRKDFTTHLMKSCMRYAERAKTEGWTVKSFSRPKELPQSVVSQMLDEVLGKTGFNL